jgi:trk system potassium uptake protein TrkA
MKVIIVGGGQVGSYLASLLLASGHDIRIIEHRNKTYHKLEKEFPSELLIHGYGSDPAILEKAGIDTADVLAAVTAEDETNLVVTTLAKMEFGVPRVIGRVNNPKNAWLYNSSMGVDVGVNQADFIAHLVVEEMDLNSMFTMMKLSNSEYSIVQTRVSMPAKAVNKTLKDLPIPKGVVLIAVVRDGIVLIPKGDTEIRAEDEIIMMTDESSRSEIHEIFG